MNEDPILLVYDEQCPACDQYCRLVRIRDSVGELRLIDARESSEIMGEITALGLDIDQGMVVKIREQIYYGADAIHVLALMSSRSGFFNRLNYWTFRSKPISRVLYPILRSCRNLQLKMLGKTKINNLDLYDNERF
ncbi:MAG: DCC1-like thiol-disulfide oxidoreductase family protein [Gammaproteobacteria bacterium]